MGDILIVDDERDIRELVSDILEDEGFTTRLAGTSDECMAQVNAEQPALMILDIWLKDSSMDGIDILKVIKLLFPGMAMSRLRWLRSSRALMTSSRSHSILTSCWW